MLMTGHRALIWNSGQIWSSIFLSFHACCLNYLSSSEHHIYIAPSVTVYHQSWLKTPPRHSRLPSWRRQRGRVDLSPRSLPWRVRHCPPDIYSFMHICILWLKWILYLAGVLSRSSSAEHVLRDAPLVAGLGGDALQLTVPLTILVHLLRNCDRVACLGLTLLVCDDAHLNSVWYHYLLDI